MVTVLGMATIKSMKANDHSREGGHPWDRLEDFDHFGEGDLPRDDDHPKNGEHHRDGDHPIDEGCLRAFYHPKGCLLKVKGAKNSLGCSDNKKFEKCDFVCLFVCLSVTK